MLDFLITYLMIDRIGAAVAIGLVVLVFAVAHGAWRRVRPTRKPSSE